MNINELSSYLPYIILIVAVIAAICFMNWYRGKKADDEYEAAMASIKIGSKVKTMFGVFGTIEDIKDVNDEKYILLKLFDGTVIEVDSRAIYSLDDRPAPIEYSYTPASSKKSETKKVVAEEENQMVETEKPKRGRKTKTE